MVAYIKSDLEFILAQIKISEQHAAGTPLFGAGGLVPAYNLSLGLRTVDGTYNNLLPGQEQWGAADIPFPEPLGTNFRPATPTAFGPPPTPLTASSYAPMYKPNADPQDPTAIVVDSSPRTISNLIVDQTLNNPAAIVTALERAGSADPFADLVIVQDAVELITTTEAAAIAAQAIETAAEAAVAAATVAQLAAQAAYDAALANNGAAVAALAATSDDAAAAADTAMEGAVVELFTGGTISTEDFALVNAAVAAALVASNAAAAVVTALTPAHAELADAQAIQANALSLHTQLVTLQGALVEGQSPAAHFAAIFAAATLAHDNVAPAESLTADLNALVDPDAVAAALANLNAANATLATAVADEATAEAASVTADAAAAAAVTALGTTLTDLGIEFDGENISLPNIAPDGGLSASFNSWFTLFGQFFDHGLDLVGKGGSGTIYIPLQPDDPLYVPGGHTNFMVLTRATVTPGDDGIMGTADDVRPINTTTSFVDQNQTYTSHSSHQVFLREYVLSDGRPVATGKLIQGDNGGMATWGELKAQAKAMLGIELTDFDVGNVPLLRTDQYGNFIPNTAGFPQVILGLGNDGIPNTADDIVVSGTPANPIDPTTVSVTVGAETYTGAVRIGHAFLADIAHDAVPVGKIADGDIEIGLGNPANGSTEYDNELLDAHFIAGDGRVNENIGLTAVHHVFHAEHNRLVEHTKAVILATGDNAFIQEWLVAGAVIGDGVSDLEWNGERLFQAAKFGTEMQYQHLVFEEFARKIQPQINPFVVPDGYDVTINPSIVAEFAHVVYRFGHSMLTETIDRFDPSFNAGHIGLIEGFLNPFEFDEVGGTAHGVTDEVAAGAIIRGMTRQVGNEIDEFVTSALRNNLLGLPLDLATINLARGRDTGVPSLNAARREFFAVTNSAAELKPYESWVEFAGNLKHEASIINFIAAYGNHALITGQTTIDGKRDAALTIITGQSVGGLEVPPDAADFLNGTGAYGVGNALGGLENVDLWIGGLAEKILPFGGMLGSTFNFVFEVSLEQLQNGDRFYYLQRLDGLHLFGEMEANSFAAMIMRNTDATHLPSDVFSVPGLILEVDRTKQYNPDLGETAGADNILQDDPSTEDVDESADNLGNDPTGGGILTPLVIRNNPATPDPDTNYLRYTGDQHVVLGGTAGNDILIASEGDDTLHGDGGNDYLEGGAGNDVHNGGDGDDIIKDLGGDDNIKGGAGNDVINSGPGLDLVLGGSGKDFVFLGNDAGGEVFGGEGDDFIYGNKNAERLLGNEGNDWLETGTFDGAPGDNFDEIFARDGVVGHDVFLGDGGFDEFIGEGGDDIMVGSPGRGKMAGMSGWDWMTYKDNTFGVDADLTRGIVFDEFPNPPVNGTLDAYESIEGVSGSKFNDILTGSDTLAADRLPSAQGGSEGFTGSVATAQSIALVAGLQALLGAGVTSYSAGDILLGGDGSDRITGRAGDDIIDGDKWLNVRISVRQNADGTGPEIASHNSMTTLAAAMFAGTYNPGQLVIVREILSTGDAVADIDTAVFSDVSTNYSFSTTADGRLVVSHAIEDGTDGTDTLSGIERLQFSDGTYGIIVGTPFNDNGGTGVDDRPVLNGTGGNEIIVGLAGSDILNGNGGNDVLIGGTDGVSGTYADNFEPPNYTGNDGSASFTGGWTESGTETVPTSSSGGDIEINDQRLRFDENVSGGEQIQRSFNLMGATAATVTFTYEDDSLDDEGIDENVVVEAWNGTSWDVLGTLGSNTNSGTGTFSAQLSAAHLRADAAVRFRTEGDWEPGENFYVDNFVVNFSRGDILNGGLGNDTYGFGLADGNDIITETGGTDRITVAQGTAAVPLAGISAQRAANGNLILGFNGQTVTVVDEFDNTNAAVEFVNFSNNNYGGLVLSGDYAVSFDTNDDDDGDGIDEIGPAGADISSLVIGTGGEDNLVGSGENDIIFGGSGNSDDTLTGDGGNDLLVGGGGDDNMSGNDGDDTYDVDDTGDDVNENANEGIDTVMSAVDYELSDNVENLILTGTSNNDGVGNALANVLTGNSGNNILDGEDGNDTLDGGAGNDTADFDGNSGNYTFTLNALGQLVVTSNVGTDGADTLIGIESLAFTDATLGLVVGTPGNDSALNGAAGAAGNQLVLGLAGNDTLNGGSGTDVLLGGDGTDTLNGGTGNDVLDGGLGADTMAGGADNDVYRVGDAGDVVNETAPGSGGTDRVETTLAAYTLGTNVENLTYVGTGNFVGTGNTLGNTIIGGALADTLSGLGGNDTYTVTAGDVIIEAGGAAPTRRNRPIPTHSEPTSRT